MTRTDPGTCFSLCYELQPGDLTEMLAANPARRRTRRRVILSAVLWTLAGVVATAITVALDSPSTVKDSTGAPSWMYVVDILFWTMAVLRAIMAWRLRSGRLAQRTWRKNPQMRGRHLDDVDSRGVSCAAPDGTRTFIPWARLVSVRETECAFALLDDTGAALSVLPKRGLDSPSSSWPALSPL
jgi:hypothetical protein